MEGLKGTRFGGAFVVMNGVPNGPINRYDPVIGSVIENNSLINSDNLQLGENGLMYPQESIKAGASRALNVTTKDMTGVSWYPKTDPIIPFQSGKTTVVKPDEGALFAAVQSAEPGDTLLLSAGEHVVGKFLKIDKPLTFKGNGNANVLFERSALFEILDGGSLQIMGFLIRKMMITVFIMLNI